MPRRAAARHSAGTWAPRGGLAACAASAPPNGANPTAAPSTPAPPPTRMFRLLTPCSMPMVAPPPTLRSTRLPPDHGSGFGMQNDLQLARDLIPGAPVRQEPNPGVEGSSPGGRAEH